MQAPAHHPHEAHAHDAAPRQASQNLLNATPPTQYVATAKNGAPVDCACCVGSIPIGAEVTYCGGDQAHPHCKRCTDMTVSKNLLNGKLDHTCSGCKSAIPPENLPANLRDQHLRLAAKHLHENDPNMLLCPNGRCAHVHNITAISGDQEFARCASDHAVCLKCRDGASPHGDGYRCNNEQCSAHKGQANVITDWRAHIDARMRQASVAFKCANPNCNIGLMKVDAKDTSYAVSQEHGCNSLAYGCGSHTCFVCHRLVEGLHFDTAKHFCSGLLGIKQGRMDSIARTLDVKEFQARLVRAKLASANKIGPEVLKTINIHDVTKPSKTDSSLNFIEANVQTLLADYYHNKQDWFDQDGRWRKQHTESSKQTAPIGFLSINGSTYSLRSQRKSADVAFAAAAAAAAAQIETDRQRQAAALERARRRQAALALQRSAISNQVHHNIVLPMAPHHNPAQLRPQHANHLVAHNHVGVHRNAPAPVSDVARYFGNIDVRDLIRVSALPNGWVQYRSRCGNDLRRFYLNQQTGRRGYFDVNEQFHQEAY